MEGIQPYSFEPTWKKIAGVEPEYESSGSDEIDINMDEVSSGNVSLCLCKSCRPMDTERESICCQEVGELNRKLDGKELSLRS